MTFNLGGSVLPLSVHQNALVLVATSQYRLLKLKKGRRKVKRTSMRILNVIFTRIHTFLLNH